MKLNPLVFPFFIYLIYSFIFIISSFHIYKVILISHKSFHLLTSFGFQSPQGEIQFNWSKCHELSILLVTFSFTLLYLQYHVFSELSLATTIVVSLFISVSWNEITLFNYGGKKTRDVGITRRCHLSNIMLDGVLYDSMGLEITSFLFLSLPLFCFFKLMQSLSSSE